MTANHRSLWMLKDGIAFLNHGSYGAVPRCVLDEQNDWRRRIEAEPVEILGRRCRDLLAAAKIPVGQLLRMRPDDFGFVTNATEAINAVFRCLKISSGDELLTTTHVYNAIRQTMRFTAEHASATYREIDIRTPIYSGQQIMDTILANLSDRTRLLVIDHVTSPTALVFPVEQIVAACGSRGIDVLIDGAHAPGMLDLSVAAINAAYYTGNLHKWACAPKGSAFLWVRPDRQADIHPNIISHHLGQGFGREFDWQGTRDISAFLATPCALDFMGDLGWSEVRRQNHDLAVWAQQMLCEKWNVQPLSLLDGSLLGSMATAQLPAPLCDMAEDAAPRFQQFLYDEHQIEVPVIRWQERWHIRVSCQVYNGPEDYLRLAGAIGGSISSAF